MEPGFIVEEEHIENRNIMCIVTGAIDKTRFVLVNRLASTCVESKFCRGRLWKEVYSMLRYVKVLSAAPVVMMQWAILWHSL